MLNLYSPRFATLFHYLILSIFPDILYNYINSLEIMEAEMKRTLSEVFRPNWAQQSEIVQCVGENKKKKE